MSAKTSIFGRLTRDVISRNVGDSTVLNYTVASDSSYRKNGKYITSFIPVEQWVKPDDGRIAMLTKGALVFVSGELLQNTFQDRQGNTRDKVFIRAENLQFGPKPRTNPSQDTESTTSTEPTPPAEDDDYPF